ncbi:MAG: hypothetical protein ABSC94_27240 [Polyangiaceae bacterium]|jgi:oligopeptidase A
MANPLLATHEAEGGPPAFDRIRPEGAEAAIDQVASQSRAELHAMLPAVDASVQRVTQDRLIRGFEEVRERLARTWGAWSKYLVWDSRNKELGIGDLHP